VRRALLLASVLGATIAHQAAADTWPTKPIHAIIPFGPGSAVDIVPRIVFEQIAAQLGQSIVVENRAGAGGTLGSAVVAKAAPDGYTMLVHSSAHSITPALYSRLSYDISRDFATVGAIGSVPNIMIMAPSKGYRTVQQYVAAAKADPKMSTYAALGVGSAVHLSAERFRLSAGFESIMVPFKGGAEGLTEVIAGRVDFYFCPISTAMPHIKEGRLLGLAASSPQRAAALPDIPTTLESGYPNSDYTFWMGIFMPAKTPPAVVARMSAELKKALDMPSVKERLAKLGVEPMPVTAEQFDAQVKNEIGTYAAFAKAANLPVN
jgi:tripartite-type tricarboxylate transporter receptor subunit TctC